MGLKSEVLEFRSMCSNEQLESQYEDFEYLELCMCLLSGSISRENGNLSLVCYSFINHKIITVRKNNKSFENLLVITLCVYKSI